MKKLLLLLGIVMLILSCNKNDDTNEYTFNDKIIGGWVYYNKSILKDYYIFRGDRTARWTQYSDKGITTIYDFVNYKFVEESIIQLPIKNDNSKINLNVTFFSSNDSIALNGKTFYKLN